MRSRSEFKTISVVLLLLPLLLHIPVLLSGQGKPKPNIIIILTDDQGYGDVGFNGNPLVRTPNLDKLAAQSTRFKNFYTSPVCSPTRASLLTGRYSFRTGIRDTYAGGSIMASEEITLAELLSGAGYTTGIYGKWHLGDHYSFRPTEQGFQHTLVHQGGGIGQPGDHIDNLTRPDSCYFNPVLFRNNEPVKTQGYCSDVFTSEAIDFIRDNKENPFFLYLAFNAPHTPLQVPQQYYDLYKNTDFDQKGAPWNQLSEKEREAAKRVFGMITNIDDNIGRLLQKLREYKLDKNTVIFFLSDNGNEQTRYNTGLKGLKQSVYEGGVRVPAIAWNPRYFPPGRELTDPVAHIDLTPTILELTGTVPPAEYKPDGRSFLSLARQNGSNKEERSLYFNWNRGYPEPYRNTALRKGPYKLVAQNARELSSFELYDLQKDPFETTNIIKEKEAVAETLKSELDLLYQDLSSSQHLSPRKTELGHPEENPVWLARQDWYGPAGAAWSSEQAYGTYFVRVNKGTYSIRLYFSNPVKAGGRAVVRLGQTQRSLLLDNDHRIVSFDTIELPDGEFSLEAWYEKTGLFASPFYIEIIKK